MAVADAWDAMVTDRPYRAGLPRDEAIRRLRDGAGTQWDERFVRAFLALPEWSLGPADRLIAGADR